MVMLISVRFKGRCHCGFNLPKNVGHHYDRKFFIRGAKILHQVTSWLQKSFCKFLSQFFISSCRLQVDHWVYFSVSGRECEWRLLCRLSPFPAFKCQPGVMMTDLISQVLVQHQTFWQLEMEKRTQNPVNSERECEALRSGFKLILENLSSANISSMINIGQEFLMLANSSSLSLLFIKILWEEIMLIP